MTAWRFLRRLPTRLAHHRSLLLALAALALLPLLLVLAPALGRGSLAPAEPFARVAGASVEPGQAPARAVQNMQAIKDGNAQLFWETLSEASRQEMRSQGVEGVDDLQQIFARASQSGGQILSYQFVARYDMRSGDTVSFFVALQRDARGGQTEVPYLITTDPEGFVKKIE